MFEKIVKYILSIIRIIILKIRFKSKVKFTFKNIKSVYIGKKVRFKIDKGNKIIFGDNVYVDDYSRLYARGGNIIIGNNVYFNTNCNVVSFEEIEIGNDCLFGSNVGIYDHDHRYDLKDIPIRKQGFTKEKVLIKNDVWVGSNSIITKGIKIEDRVIIAANSVVSKELLSNSIYGGVPCKLIKKID